MTNAKQLERLATDTDAMPQDNQSSDDSSRLFAWAIAEAADERKAADIVILKVGDVSYLADYFVVATGFSRAQVRAIADAIAARTKEQFQRSPLRTDGQSERSWIVQDFGDTIVHVLLPEEREYYDIEAFWGHAQRFEFTPDDDANAASK